MSFGGQIKKLKALQPGGLAGKKKVSLLFDIREAQDISIESIFLIAKEGLAELIKLDHQFQTYETSLFSAAGKDLDRELQTKEVNEKIDKSIATFLKHLSPYFLLRPAHKVFEFLLRRYRVHENNVNDILKCIFPYHETNLFVRILVFLRIHGEPWNFLTRNQKTGSPLDQGTVVTRCITDSSFLSFLTDMVIESVQLNCSFPTQVSFYGVVLTQVIARQSSIDENFLANIVPHIRTVLTVGGTPAKKSSSAAAVNIRRSLQTAGYMAISQLVTRTRLVDKVMNNLIDNVIATSTPLSFGDALLCVIFVTQTQSISSFNNNTVARLVQTKDLVSYLVQFEKKSYEISHFLSLLLSSLVSTASLNDENSFNLLQNILESVHLTVPLVSQMIVSLLQKTCLNNDIVVSSDIEGKIVEILRLVDSKYPESLNVGISTALKPFMSNKKDKSKHKNVLEFISRVFHGTRHEMINIKDTTTTLYLSLEHPNQQVRLLAVEQLEKMVHGQNLTEADHLFIEEAYLRRLKDDDYQIVEKVLKMDYARNVKNVPELLNALLNYLPPKQDIPEKIQLGALEAIMSAFPKSDAVNQRSIITQLLFGIVFRSKNEKFSFAALKALKNSHYPLFSNLPQELVNNNNNLKQSQINELNSLLFNTLGANLIQQFNGVIDLFEGILGADSHLNQVASIVALVIVYHAIQYHSESLDSDTRIRVLTQFHKMMSFSLLKRCQEYFDDKNSAMVSGILMEDSPSAEQILRIVTNHTTSSVVIPFFFRLLLVLIEQFPEIPSVAHFVAPRAAQTPAQSALNALSSLYVGLVEMPLEISSKHIQTLFAVHFPDHRLFKFLSHAIQSISMTNPAHKIRHLNFMTVFVRSLPEKRFNLQILLPLLLVPLQDPHLQGVRAASMECIGALYEYQKKSPSKDTVVFGITENPETSFYGEFSKNIQLISTPLFVQFLGALLQAKNELLGDSNHLKDFYQSIFVDNNRVDLPKFSPVERMNLTNYLVSNFLLENHVESKRILFENLVNIHSQEKFTLIKPVIIQLVNQAQIVQISKESLEFLRTLLAELQPVNAVLIDKPDFMNTIIQLLSAENSPGTPRVNPIKLMILKQFADTKTFEALSTENQVQVFNTLCKLRSFVDSDPRTRDIIYDIIKSHVSASVVAKPLEDAAKAFSPATGVSGKRQKNTSESATSSPVFTEKSLLDFTNIMETLAFITNTEGADQVIRLLFSVLPLFVAVDRNSEDSSLDYTTKRCLEIIGNFSGKISAKQAKSLEDVFDIDIIIQCLRVFTDSSLRNTALVCLNSITALFPHKAVSHIMPLFTYMGASAVLQEDNYSWSVIRKTVEQIVPTVIKRGVGAKPLVDIFVKALPNIPVHRRVLLFAILVKTLGSLNNLAPVILSVFSTEIQQTGQKLLKENTGEPTNEESSVVDSDISDKLDTLSFCHSLCHEFSPVEVVTAMEKLISAVVLASNVSSQEDKESYTKLRLSEFYNESTLDSSKQELMRYCILDFVADHIASAPFLDSLLAATTKHDQTIIQTGFLKIFQLTLQHLQHTSQCTENSKKTKQMDKTSIKLWREMVKLGYNLLENLNDLLALPGFIVVISQLLRHPDPQIRRRALVLFNEKIEAERDELSDKQLQLFMNMLGNIAKIIKDDNKDSDHNAADELDVNKQSALLSFEILGRNFAKKKPAPFLSTVPAMIRILSTSSNPQVAASAAICLATVSAELGAQMLPHLSQLVPAFLRVVKESFARSSSSGAQKSTEENKKNVSLLQISVLSALQMIIASLAKFISPSIGDIIGTLTHPNVVLSTNVKATEKVATLFTTMAENIEPRLLFNAIFVSFKPISEMSQTKSLVLLIDFLRDVCSTSDFASIQGAQQRLFKFFLALFDLAVKHQKNLDIEEHVIDAFVALVMKLNENMFKPFILKIIDWGKISSSTVPEDEEGRGRQVFFYHLLDSITQKLKAIIVPYFGYVLDNAIACLNDSLEQKNESVGPENDSFFASDDEDDEDSKSNSSVNKNHLRMLKHILSSLRLCFANDMEGFINKDKFDKLLPPLANQLENTIGGSEEFSERTEEYLVPCLAQLAVCAGNDTLWKPLNYQILLKTRSEVAKVRYAALRAIQECYSKLGEELLVLLPETIPFLAELMEDPNPQVEKLSQEVIKQIEQFLGEDTISSYL